MLPVVKNPYIPVNCPYIENANPINITNIEKLKS
jgi:hypothetical protein